MEGRIQSFKGGPDNPHFGMRPVWSMLGEFSDLLDLDTVWRNELQVREEMKEKLGRYGASTVIPEGGRIMESFRAGDLKIEDKSPLTPAKPSDVAPYLLLCGNSALHTGWITQHSANLINIDGRQVARMHPDDAKSENITEGQVVRIGTADTGLNIPVEITPAVNKGEILILNSFENNPVNRLFGRDGGAVYVSVRKT